MFSKYQDFDFVRGGRTPETGFDCYGLVRYVLSKECGIVLPNFDIELESRVEAQKVQGRVLDIMNGVSFPLGWNEILDESIQQFDILWLRSLYPVHFGIAIDEKDFLHIEAGKNSVIESIHESRWANKLLGVYRHDRML